MGILTFENEPDFKEGMSFKDYGKKIKAETLTAEQEARE